MRGHGVPKPVPATNDPSHKAQSHRRPTLPIGPSPIVPMPTPTDARSPFGSLPATDAQSPTSTDAQQGT